MIDALRLDLRYALRTLQRTPLFAVGVALTIGVGLGVWCSGFIVLNGYLLKPYDIRDPHRVYELSWDTSAERRHAMSIDDVAALRRDADVFEDVLAFGNVQLSGDGLPLYGQLVTGNYFAALGVRPLAGRLLDETDAVRPGERAVAVLSHDAWTARFGADPDVVGRTIRLGRLQFTVVGVAQPGFGGFSDAPIGFWVPVTMAAVLPVRDPYGADRPSVLTVLARTRGGVRETQAAAWFDAWIRQRLTGAAAADRVTLSRFESRATRIPLNGRTLSLFLAIEAAFAMVLLIARANVGNLMLARGIARQREIAVRLSVGAARVRIIRQLSIESLLLALPAAAVGYALALVTARVIPAVVVRTWPEGLPPVTGLLVPLDPDVRVAAFLFLGALVAASLFGLVPALQTSRTSLSRAARGEFGASLRLSRVRSVLVVVQIAACAAFLVMATGVVDELRRLSRTDTGLAIDAVADVRVPREYRRAVADRLAADPRVLSVAAAYRPPLYGPLWTLFVSRAGVSETVPVGVTVVSPEYFELFGIPLAAGRGFTADESAARAEVAVVSEATAHRFWPGLDPIGQTLDVSEANRRLPGVQRVTERHVRVIGVARDVTSGALADGRDPTCVYLPTSLEDPGSLALLVRARGDITSLRAALAAASAAVREDAAFPVYPMRDVVGLQMWVMGAFSATGALLAAIGLVLAISGTYGVVAFIVIQRRREFGIRVALGATGAAIVRGMIAEAARLAAAGTAAGALLALGLSRLLASIIEILPTFGPDPFALGAAVILTATLAAALVPSLRAARVDPSEALRAD